jgi:O-antigen/teichoic acid export membrane protein
MWTAGSVAATMAMRLITLAVLGRELSREDFGLASMLVAILATLQAFGDFGLGSAIVQGRELGREQLSSIFWMAQIFGVVAFLGVVALEPLFAVFYGEPRLDGLAVWLALRFLVMPVGIPFQARLQRDLRFRDLFVIQSIAAVTGGALSIAGAIAGLGIYALIWGELASAVMLAALSLGLGWGHWHPCLRLRREDLRGHVGFGLYQVGERAANMFAMNIDYILIGRTLGAVPLGFYSVAFEIASIPTRLNPVLTRVALPIFSRRQDDAAALGRGYTELSRLVALVQFPVLTGIVALGDLVVPLLLGTQWTGAVPLVRVLALFGMVRVLGNPSGSMLLAKGRADIGFRVNLVFAIVNGLVFWFIVQHGALAVAWAWIGLVLAQLAVLTGILRCIIALDVAGYLAALVRPFALAGLAAAYLHLGRMLAAAAGAGALGQLMVALLVGLLLWLPSAWLLERSFLTKLWVLVRGARDPA